MAAKITQGFTCPCGAWTRVLSTRMGKIRRRECANLHRFYTEEVMVGPSSIQSQQEKKNGPNLAVRLASSKGISTQSNTDSGDPEDYGNGVGDPQ